MQAGADLPVTVSSCIQEALYLSYTSWRQTAHRDNCHGPMADSRAGGDLSGPSAMQSQSPLGRRKGLPLRALPSSPSASSVSPPAAQSITFPLRPPRSPQARGPEAERTEGQKQRQARSAASPANGTATRGWFRAGGFRTPLRAAQTQPQTLRRTLFQKLPSLTLSGFTLYLPIRQQQSTKDAALGLLNRQAREQSVPLLQQEDLVPRAQQHARSGHNTALVRSLCTENANLRSMLATGATHKACRKQWHRHLLVQPEWDLMPLSYNYILSNSIKA